MSMPRLNEVSGDYRLFQAALEEYYETWDMPQASRDALFNMAETMGETFGAGDFGVELAYEALRGQVRVLTTALQKSA